MRNLATRWRRPAALAVLLAATFTLMGTSSIADPSLEAELSVTLSPGESRDVLITATRRAVRPTDTSAVAISAAIDTGVPVPDAGMGSATPLTVEMPGTAVAPQTLTVALAEARWAEGWHEACDRDACERVVRLTLDPVAVDAVTVTVTPRFAFQADQSFVCAGATSYADSAELTVTNP